MCALFVLVPVFAGCGGGLFSGCFELFPWGFSFWDAASANEAVVFAVAPSAPSGCTLLVGIFGRGVDGTPDDIISGGRVRFCVPVVNVEWFR